ncbi:MAG: PAS domain-containing protein [Phycisphaera sp.]|nr:PAS domain-containing protein [Phycisphaera sp.]
MNSIENKPRGSYEGKCKEMMDAVLGAVHESMIVLSADLRVVAANSGFVRATGVASDEIVGRAFEDVIANRWSMPGLVEMLQDVVKSGVPVDNLELTHRARGAEFRTLRINARRIAHPDGGEPFVVLCMDDVTVARRLDRVRDDLLATVSHDLRTPLSALQGFTRVLIEQHDLSPEKTREYLRIIHDEAQYLNLLVERFVDHVV